MTKQRDHTQGNYGTQQNHAYIIIPIAVSVFIELWLSQMHYICSHCKPTQPACYLLLQNLHTRYELLCQCDDTKRAPSPPTRADGRYLVHYHTNVVKQMSYKLVQTWLLEGRVRSKIQVWLANK